MPRPEICVTFDAVEKPGMKMLQDPFTQKPHILYYAYKRTGGGARDFHAIKFLKTGT